MRDIQEIALNMSVVSQTVGREIFTDDMNVLQVLDVPNLDRVTLGFLSRDHMAAIGGRPDIMRKTGTGKRPTHNQLWIELVGHIPHRERTVGPLGHPERVVTRVRVMNSESIPRNDQCRQLDRRDRVGEADYTQTNRVLRQIGKPLCGVDRHVVD